MGKYKRNFKVIESYEADDDGNAHFAVWSESTGAVAGRYYKKSDAEKACARINDGTDIPNYNYNGVV